VAGDDAGALALLEQAREPVLATADGRLVKRYYTNLTHILYSFARYEESIAVAREGIELHERAGLDRLGQMCVHENAAGALCALGRPAEAAALIADADGPFTSDTLCLHIRLAGTALMVGDLDAAAARIDRACRVAETEPMVLVPASAMRADVALWCRDLETARAAVSAGESTLVEADRLDAAGLLAVGIRTQAEGAEVGVIDAGAARAEADRLLQRLRRVVAQGPGRLPEPDALLREGEAERSRLDDAPDPDPWRAAAAAWQALGRPYEVAYASWRAAGALAAAGAPRDELEGALCVAHDAALGVGAVHVTQAVEALARRARVRLPGMVGEDAVAFPDLTPRERDVLALVAEGRTNNQIAEALFITGKTASVHVSNILAKLDAANRGEAAALAHRAGFVPVPGTHA
jgi:DNA-binding CsgD family transcriptional regulator